MYKILSTTIHFGAPTGPAFHETHLFGELFSTVGHLIDSAVSSVTQALTSDDPLSSVGGLVISFLSGLF